MPKKGYSSVTLPTRLVNEARSVLRSPSGARYRSLTELVSEALDEKLDHLRGSPIVSVGDVSLDDAVRLITEHLRKNPGSHYPSDIAYALGLDLELVFRVTQNLLREHVVEVVTEKELAAH